MKESHKKIITYVVGPLVIVVLGLSLIHSVMEPVEFGKQKNYRESVAIQRLKDIRSLQVAYKGENGHFTASMDSLITFYKNGTMSVVMQIGSKDDSLAVANTERIKNEHLKKVIKKKTGKRKNQYVYVKPKTLTPEDLYKMYLEGEKSLVFSVTNRIAVKDTLFKRRSNFCIDSLAYIPFSGGEKVELSALIKTVSGVPVPLFEAKVPYKLLLKGLDNQLRINLDAERKTQNRYTGLQVGSISAPNNNAGNWE